VVVPGRLLVDSVAVVGGKLSGVAHTVSVVDVASAVSLLLKREETHAE